MSLGAGDLPRLAAAAGGGESDDNVTLVSHNVRPYPPQQQQPAKVQAGPFCRLFVVCSKACSQEDIRRHFLPYGNVTQVFVIKDKLTKQNRGCAFVTFQKASQALRALEALQEHPSNLSSKPVKAYLARDPKDTSQKSDIRSPEYLDSLTKVQICLGSEETEEFLRSTFSQSGPVQFVNIFSELNSRRAYVKFEKASHAAAAIEACPPQYRARLAKDAEQHCSAADPAPLTLNSGPLTAEQSMMAAAILGLPHRELEVKFNPKLPGSNLYALFDVVPGLEKIRAGAKVNKNTAICYPLYKTPLNALYAKEKLNGFEYPLGSFLIVSFRSDVRVSNGVITSHNAAASSSSEESQSTARNEDSGEESDDDSDKDERDDDDDDGVIDNREGENAEDEEDNSSEEDSSEAASSSPNGQRARERREQEQARRDQQPANQVARPRQDSTTSFESTSTVLSTDPCGTSRLHRNISLLAKTRKIAGVRRKTKKQRNKNRKNQPQKQRSSDSESSTTETENQS